MISEKIFNIWSLDESLNGFSSIVTVPQISLVWHEVLEAGQPAGDVLPQAVPDLLFAAADEAVVVFVVVVILAMDLALVQEPCLDFLD